MEVKTKHGPKSLLAYLLQRIVEYAKIDPAPSAYEIFVKRGLMYSLFSESEREEAQKNPPETRATYRKALKKWVENETHEKYAMTFYKVDWSTLDFTAARRENEISYRRVHVAMDNPYRARMDQAEINRVIEMTEEQSKYNSDE